ncbi:MAG: hypothetical protein M1608_17400 [Candidatus Omnitrophica bacterium]|nr:hypothetical protein [Candidatus Omnitrophota bacterium]
MNPTTTLLGGQEIEVTHLDGTSEVVKVRQLPIKDLPRYQAVFEDEAKTVELFCENPAGWSDSLAADSFLKILELGEKLNLDFLAQYAARSKARRERIMPGLMDKILDQALRSTNSPPGLPSKPV